MKHVIRSRHPSDIILNIVVYVAIAFAIIITLYPVYFVVIASFSDASLVSTGQVLLLPKGITFEGYSRIFEDSRIWIGYRNTIIYTIVGTLFSLVCTLPAAYAMSRKELPFKSGIMLFFSITMFFGGLDSHLLPDAGPAFD